MVDWKQLFEISAPNFNGDVPSQYKVMSQEDRDWVTNEIAKYDFDDTDRLK